MRILVACEESQAITIELRKLGHIAFSCDLLPCSGGHPEWHIQGDVLEQLDKGWDMMIAHPPCTFLAGSGVAWLSHPEDRDLPFEDRRPHPLYPNRKQFWDAVVDALDSGDELPEIPIDIHYAPGTVFLVDDTMIIMNSFDTGINVAYEVDYSKMHLVSDNNREKMLSILN